jgi:antitoxin (DNA-binding transcriptional repressor) of toxin-antitoxin stability system
LLVPRLALTILTLAASLGEPAAAHAARPAPVKDYSKQVEVIVGGRLRESRPGQGELSLSLWNTTKDSVAGPIFLVIDDTGIEAVKVGSHTEETAKGQPVFEIVPAGRALRPGGMTPSLAVAFTMPAGLGREETDQFQLKARVFARQAPQDAATVAREKEEREDAEFATRGKRYDGADLAMLRALQKQVTPDLMKKPDVIGTAITEDDKGNLALRVYTETRSAAKTLPSTVGKYPVDVHPVPGKFKVGPTLNTVTRRNGVATSKKTREAQAEAQKSAAQTGRGAKPQLVTPVDPTQRFERPVPIGVSSFNAETLDAAGQPLCATGTLGCRLIDSSGKIYGLSNAHVYSDFGFDSAGEAIVQPGQGDNNCNPDVVNNTIGTLIDTSRYQNSNVTSIFYQPVGLTMNFIDAAIMEVALAPNAAGDLVPAVGVSTPSDGYGTPSSRILRQNRIGLQVQKYGRTTGYTRGRTTAVEIFAPVGGNPDTTENYRLDEFVGMAGSQPFGDSGDSGSLIVTLADRRPVAHLFAGNSVSTLGNEIGPVLDRFNVRIDDGSNPNATTAGTGTAGLAAREGIAFGNITGADLDTVILTDTAGNIIAELLPPELRDRVKKNQRPLIPARNGIFQ